MIYYMISRGFVAKNVNLLSISLYVIIFGVIVFLKPSFLYNVDGSLREFGLGSNKKTVLPVWLVSILTAIMSYFFVLYYLASPKLNF